MQLEEGYIYHIYNQGNNHEKIFFERGNFLFFLKKIKVHILPYADILAWCLMPNHFHLMVLVNVLEMEVRESGGATLSRTPTTISLNKSLGIMLASYTRALNKRNNTSGSIFRSKTKAECVNCPNGITPSFIVDNSITKINTVKPEEQYPQVCFDYIHANPVKAKLVKNINDWPFSSASDYAGIRDGKLVNKQVAYKYLGRL